MTNKERLEEMLKEFEWAENDIGEYQQRKVEFYDDNTGWLIERVQELEEENQKLKAIDDATTHELNHVDKQNKRYREALKEINQLWERSTDATDDTNLAWKMSCEAHKALESGNGDN